MTDVKTIQVGYLETNCYILTDVASGRKAIVDPGYKSKTLLEAVESLGKDTFDYILLTHGHFDHIWYAQELKKLTDAEIVIGELEKEFLSDGNLNLSSGFRFPDFPEIIADVTLKDGEIFSLGETEIRFIHTPGHTRGGGCYLLEADKILFSGDTLFKCSMGRTDFATGNPEELFNSLKKLSKLQGDYAVYPGHGEPTSLEYERKNNPYIY